MRPRVFPAEDSPAASAASAAAAGGFNEAAGIPRGRPWFANPPSPRFNEAAGIPRGRRDENYAVQRFGFELQ